MAQSVTMRGEHMAQKLLEQSVTMRGAAHGKETSRTVSDRFSHWEY